MSSVATPQKQLYNVLHWYIYGQLGNKIKKWNDAKKLYGCETQIEATLRDR